MGCYVLFAGWVYLWCLGFLVWWLVIFVWWLTIWWWGGLLYCCEFVMFGVFGVFSVVINSVGLQQFFGCSWCLWLLIVVCLILLACS